MRTLSKIEGTVSTLAMGFVLWLTSVIGAWELLYESSFLDMYSDEAMVLYIPYLIVVTYWVIKKIVLRIIRIIRN